MLFLHDEHTNLSIFHESSSNGTIYRKQNVALVQNRTPIYYAQCKYVIIAVTIFLWCNKILLLLSIVKIKTGNINNNR